jgi:hypothetical protein
MSFPRFSLVIRLSPCGTASPVWCGTTSRARPAVDGTGGDGPPCAAREAVSARADRYARGWLESQVTGDLQLPCA